LELKFADVFEQIVSGGAFNRTKLELKYAFAGGCKDWFASFNRTKLELKSWLSRSMGRSLVAFNRTKLELKYVGILNRYGTQTLLIAPNWNWNHIRVLLFIALVVLLIAPNWNWNLQYHFPICHPQHAFNRTKLELKWNTLRIHRNSYCSFNRTKLELKFRTRSLRAGRETSFNRTKLELKFQEGNLFKVMKFLLIAPNWNWNRVKFCDFLQKWFLLIAPNWNWNHPRPSPERTTHPF